MIKEWEIQKFREIRQASGSQASAGQCRPGQCKMGQQTKFRETESFLPIMLYLNSLSFWFSPHLWRLLLVRVGSRALVVVGRRAGHRVAPVVLVGLKEGDHVSPNFTMSHIKTVSVSAAGHPFHLTAIFSNHGYWFGLEPRLTAVH